MEGNGITGATSDFTARKEIHINDEFHAQYGSEVHIVLSTVFSDCPDYSGYRTSSQHSSSIKYQSTNKKWIELLFKLGNEVADVQAIPNPTNGYGMVRITGTDSFKGELILTDMAGRNIFSKNINALSEQLSLSNLSKGIYYLEIKNSTQDFNKKIVLN